MEVRKVIEAGLVLEGGGMRGVYTAGVLDWLMDRGLWFRNIYGVSAGACHACSYVSRQRGRAARTVLGYAHDKRYMGLSNWLRTGNFFGVDFIYRQLPDVYEPFDHAAYGESGMNLYSVVFNCRTGEAEYPQARRLDAGGDMPMILASSSLPMLSRMVWHDGMPYLDGGLLDSVPLARAKADGNGRSLVVLTQHKGYEKGPNAMMPALRVRYARYPRLVEAMRVRHERYNEQVALVHAEAAAGRAVVIQPSTPVTLDRIERNQGKLEALYRQGYEDAEAAVGAVEGLFGAGDGGVSA